MSETTLNLIFERLKRIEERLAKLEYLQVIEEGIQAMPSNYKTPCMWELMPEADKFKPIGFSCPCPKCTPRC